MLEHQDIDALLISALYGELSPAEEARLATHLETHPADKTALAALTSTRAAVRESRLFEVQLEPPQSVSALLLQEAHRRAPKPAEKEGWFARLARSFMAHPAMAAAAMLVIVLGVATLLRSRKGDEVGQQYADDSAMTQPAPTAAAGSAAAGPAVAATPPADHGDRARDLEAQEQGAIAAGSGSADSFQVGLAEDAKQDKADSIKTATVAETKPTDQQVAQVQKGKDAPAKKISGGLEVRRPEPQPKDLDGAEDDGIVADRYNKESVNAITPATPSTGAGMGGGGAVVGGASAGRGDAPGRGQVNGPSNGAYAVPPPGNAPAAAADNRKNQNETRTTTPTAPPAASPTPAPARTVQQAPSRNAPMPPPPPPAPPRKAEKAEKVAPERPKAAAPAEDKAPAPNDPELAWARQQHEAMVALAEKGNCSGTTPLALKLANRDRAYYQTNVVTDRRLKSCMAYIVGPVDKEASERAEKQRALQRRNEPAPTAIDSTK